MFMFVYPLISESIKLSKSVGDILQGSVKPIRQPFNTMSAKNELTPCPYDQVE